MNGEETHDTTTSSMDEESNDGSASDINDDVPENSSIDDSKAAFSGAFEDDLMVNDFLDVSQESDTVSTMLPKAASKSIGGLGIRKDSDDDDTQTEDFVKCKPTGDFVDYRDEMIMKEGCGMSPMWVTPMGVFIVEKFSPFFKQCTQFLLAVSEPISRCDQIHHYRLTAYSLYAAVSIGCKTDEILDTMNRFSKNVIPVKVVDFIRECTTRYGKVKLVLSEYPEVVNTLMCDNILKDCMNLTKFAYDDEDDSKTLEANEEPQSLSQESFRIAIADQKVELVQKRTLELDYPLLNEYEFRSDKTLPLIGLTMRLGTVLRDYQREGLSKMMSGGRARSGIIVLPCGAGKTLVGVAASSTINRRCMVLCNSGVSVEQWTEQFLTWTHISKSKICRFTSDSKDKASESSVCISTYSMIVHSQKRSFEATRMMEWIKSLEWGLLVLDEVHTIPAKMFRRVLTIIRAHCKLGLTATLVREDDKIQDLNFLIGPKLFEANWMDLQRQGNLARVLCSEVHCPMTKEFFAEYLDCNRSRVRTALSVMNPTKFKTCECLINYHEKANDKVIVFSDSVFALKYYASKLGKPYIHGPMAQHERLKVLGNFMNNPRVKTIFVSKVADTSFDLPDANVLIQISSQAGSRRQEAQRLGRILRPKKGSARNEYNAFFYSLVSKDTSEVHYSSKRQSFLINQGYNYKLIHSNAILNLVPSKPNNSLMNPSMEREILQLTLAITADMDSETVGNGADRKNVQNKKGSLGKLSGAATARTRTITKQQQQKRHLLFRKYRS